MRVEKGILGMEKARVLIYGTGAIGTVYAHVLSRNCQVSVTCRSNYDAVVRDGLLLKSDKFGVNVLRPEYVFRSAQEAADVNVKFDYVLVATKSIPTRPSLADNLAPIVNKCPNIAIVLIQNGLGNEEGVRTTFPTVPIVSCAAYIATSQESPGVVRHQEMEKLLIGQYDQYGSQQDVSALKARGKSERDKFADLITKGGATAEVTDNLFSAKWQKNTWNIVLSSLCTISRCDTSTLINQWSTKKVVETALEEYIQISKAIGNLEVMHNIYEITTKMKPYKPSMLLDLEAHRPMEVEVIVGYPVRRALELGVPCPTLQTLYLMLTLINENECNAAKL